MPGPRGGVSWCVQGPRGLTPRLYVVQLFGALEKQTNVKHISFIQLFNINPGCHVNIVNGSLDS